ncbi:MAG: cyanophycinase [Xanthomonadales bacterium]|jgi:cyanophycinase|nr:cyanophycinase [Xanthomonadales bacterium]
MPARGRKVLIRTRALLGAWVLSCLAGLTPAWADGTLLIVGGALREDNAEVHRALIEAMLPVGPMVIIPAASGRPARSAAAFAGSLEAHGVPRERIKVFPLAVRDDTDTADVDESQWLENAWRSELIENINDAAGFWFTGGDQVRITQTLVNTQQQESPLLELVRERLAAGAVVGGSSAGAAIMSHDMIAGGTSFTSLLEPMQRAYTSTDDQDSGRLFIHHGLGFLPDGIVDQHFDRKARLGRLVRALAATGQRRGFGIDENTALEIRLGDDFARVLGQGSVTLLDASTARFGFDTPQLASNLVLSIVAPGVSFRQSDFSILSGQGSPTVGKEYFGYAPVQGGGMALANPRLDQALGFDLLDNDSTRQLQRYSIDSDGRIIVYRFTQTPQSQGHWRSEGSVDRYTISGVRFDILRGVAQIKYH